MFSYFAPRYVKEGRAFLKNARKLLHYKRDLLSEATIADFETQMQKLDQAIRDRDRKAVDDEAGRLDKLAGAFSPPHEHAGWRENCEVFLVAIVIAVGVRTYFLQPFTIPTGSMQPTLNGIIGYSTPGEPPPNFPKQVFEFVWRGRNYINVVSKADDRIDGLREIKRLRFFTFSEIAMASGATYMVYAQPSTLESAFGVLPGRQYRSGDIIARGHVDAGDHVFVNKISYNFTAPTRGDVFVFKTNNIRGIEDGLRRRGINTSEFYIKRLAGTPGDELRIDPPNLYVNGRLADEPGFRRVMAAQDGYRGYCNMPPGSGFHFLRAPDQPLVLPPTKYFALGDNSYNSSDSRDWGTVPQENIMGRGMFVYWPFAPHFGLIR